MKKIIASMIFVLTVLSCAGQNDYKYILRAFGGLSVGGNYVTKYFPVKIDSITSNGTDIKFWHNGSILEATPGAGAASWGSITGLLSSQTDLSTALGLKANANNAAFTGTTTGITAGMVGAMSTSHAANAITGTDITNWGTAYTNNLRWDGGSTSLVAATGRTSLGGTTVGQAFFTLTNPGAITFPRINTDNSVSALSAADLKTALSLTSSDVGLGNVTNESKATMFTSPAFTGSVPTTAGIPMSRVYSDTMLVSAGVLRTKATTITTEPYSVQIFSSGGKDITHAVSDSVALNGGVYKLYVYSVDALTGAKIKILY